MAESNRRNFPRQNEEAVIHVLLAPVHSNGRRESHDFLPAKLRNHSEEGLYIEIDQTLQTGSVLSIKMTSPSKEHPEEAYHMYDGRVIWCKKVNGEISRFGVGIQILRRVVVAAVLTSRFK